MHSLLIFILVAFSSYAMSKNGVKTLTESLGQEVIEIGNPIKELPADIEEEPSIENEEDEHVTTRPTTLTTKLSTKRDSKKPALITSSRPRKPNAILNSDEEEERIEKELADIYKDTVDYKDSGETTSVVVMKIVPQNKSTEAPGNSTGKSLLRSNDRDNFKFQPDPFNKAEIERFRTSVDDISCGKRLKVTDDAEKGEKGSSYRIVLNILVFNFCLFARLLI